MAAAVVVAAELTVGGAVFNVVVELMEILDELHSLVAEGVSVAAMTAERIKAYFVHTFEKGDTTTDFTRDRILANGE